MDKLSSEQRSAVMKRVRSQDTKPEMAVRRLVYSLGYRYRVHITSLPGRPDLVFIGRRKIIFVHGCLWHSHEGCPFNRRPSSRQEYWNPKLDGNKQRDAENQLKLREQGWDVLVVWECEVKKDQATLSDRIRAFLENR